MRVLTSEERDYYQKLVDAMRSGNPKQALTNFGVVLPETIINAVFEDIKEEHPLLSEIRFENAGALIKYLYSSLDGRHLAFWGPLCGTITKELAASFAFLDMEQTKLSAWLPVCKAMLDLGPEWLDRYVRSMPVSYTHLDVYKRQVPIAMRYRLPRPITAAPGSSHALWTTLVGNGNRSRL